MTYYGEVKEKGGGALDVTEYPSIEELPESLGDGRRHHLHASSPTARPPRRCSRCSTPHCGRTCRRSRPARSFPLQYTEAATYGSALQDPRRRSTRRSRRCSTDDCRPPRPGRPGSRPTTATAAASARIGYPIGVRGVRVVARRQLTPRMLRLTLGGPALAGFHTYQADDHVKIVFPDPDGTRRDPVPDGQGMLDWPAPLPTTRKYTVRRYDRRRRRARPGLRAARRRPRLDVGGRGGGRRRGHDRRPARGEGVPAHTTTTTSSPSTPPPCRPSPGGWRSPRPTSRPTS